MARAPGLVLAATGLARGRDRHRRVAPGRALRAAGRPDRDGDGGRGKGSGRSVPAYDLHAGLAAAGAHLQRFGGHRAAAGLTIDADRVEAFAAALRCARRRASAAGRRPQRRQRGGRRRALRPRSRSSWPTSSPGSSRSASATPASPCSPRRRRSTASRRMGEGGTCACRSSSAASAAAPSGSGTGDAAESCREARPVRRRLPALSATSGTARRRLRCCVRAVAARGRAAAVPGAPRNGMRAAAACGSVERRPRRRPSDRHRRARCVAAGGAGARARRRRRSRAPACSAAPFGPSGSAPAGSSSPSTAPPMPTGSRRGSHQRRGSRPAGRRRPAASSLAELGSSAPRASRVGPGRGRRSRERWLEQRAPLRDALAPSGERDRDGAAPALPAETVERCRDRARASWGSTRAPTCRRAASTSTASPTYRAAQEQRRRATSYGAVPAARRAGPAGTRRAPLHLDMWAWQRCRAAPKPSGTTHSWPSCSAGSRRTTRTPTPL